MVGSTGQASGLDPGCFAMVEDIRMLRALFEALFKALRIFTSDRMKSEKDFAESSGSTNVLEGTRIMQQFMTPHQLSPAYKKVKLY